MTSLIKKRNDYYKMIWEYERRRRNLRIKYGLHPEWPKMCPPEYGKIADVYTRKIRLWRRQLRKLDKLRDDIVFIEKSVTKFIGVNIKVNASNKPDVILAKYIYYKYGLENGFRGVDLIQHLGGKDKECASRGRTKLTKSFKTNPENKELWERFKRFHQRRLESESNRNISSKKVAA